MSRLLAFQDAQVRDEASLGSTRLVSLVSGGGGWAGGPERGGLGEQPPTEGGKGGAWTTETYMYKPTNSSLLEMKEGRKEGREEGREEGRRRIPRKA